jgi:hypothetical protein
MVAHNGAAGGEAQDIKQASALLPLDERSWSALRDGPHNGPESVRTVTQGGRQGTRRHQTSPEAGHSHSERGDHSPGARPQRGGSVPASQGVGSPGAGTHRPRWWEDWHETCSLRGYDTPDDHRPSGGRRMRGTGARNRAKSPHRLFSIPWSGWA